MDAPPNGPEIEDTEVPLETKMECLEINEPASCSTNAQTESPQKRILRKRVPQINNIDVKRRVSTQPKKHLTADSNSTKDINQIYMCKKIKRFALNLETIFEEPKVGKSNEVLYGDVKKKRRFLIFDPTNKGKIKKRQQKVKKLFGKSVLKKKRSSMDLLLKKLCDVE